MPGSSYGTSHEHSRPTYASRRASEFFCDDVLQDLVLETQLGEHLLQLGVLFLELPEPFDVRGFHAAILRLPVVIRRRAHPVIAADVRQASACFDLFEDLDDLVL